MAKQIKISAYEYEELSDKAKTKVQEWLNSDWGFDKYSQEEWVKKLEELGYSDIEMQYTGFYSQGDGASITCRVDIRKFLTRNDLLTRFSPVIKWLEEEEQYFSIQRKQWGHYAHEKLLYFSSEDLEATLESYGIEINKTIAGIIQAVGELILQEVQEKSVELYEWLRTDYEYQHTDEYMTDMCEANQYLFDLYGNPIHHLEVDEVELA